MEVGNAEIPWDGNGKATTALAPEPQSHAGSNGDSVPPRTNGMPRILLHGVALHAITENRCIEFIMSELAAGRGGVAVTPNVDHLRRCGQDLSFSAVVHEADLVLADGMPLVWASRLQGTPLPQRVAGSDLISSLSGAAASQGRSVFFLGGDPGTADGAAALLRERYPQLKIAGTLCPPLGFDMRSDELNRLAEVLRAAKPDIVMVGLGSPKQERLIDRLRQQLPNTWWLGVGVSFSFLVGHVKRAPMWMRRWGLEWVHRLSQEPKRLFKRYVMVGMPFASAMLAKAAIQGVPNRLLPRRLERMQDQITQLIRKTTVPQPVEPARMELSEEAPPQPAAIAEMPRPRTNRIGNRRNAKPLAGLVLLGGSVRHPRLAQAAGRNLLDLPIGNGQTILSHWLDQADRCAQMAGMDNLTVRILLDATSSQPQSAASSRFTVERDEAEFRGTGGLLATLAQDYDDEDEILVANAAQVLLDPLAALLVALRRSDGVVSVVGHRDGTASGMMMVTCKALRLIPKVGFVDMKEQGLAAIARRYDVRVLHCRRPTGLSIRSLADYIQALRAVHGGRSGHEIEPLAEEWKPTFAIVEPGAQVAPTARIHDSVVLNGAVVEADAVVVRSIIGPGGIVRRDGKAVDQYVMADAKVLN